MLWALLWLLGCGDPPTVPLEVQPPPTPDPRVHLLPSTPAVPHNALEFQVACDVPMALSMQKMTVLTELGTEVPGSVPQMVWDEHLHVGRFQPQGLEPGRAYQFRLTGLRTAEGEDLPEQGWRVVVSQADTTRPDGDAVRVVVPDAGEVVAEVHFPEPMDRRSEEGLSVLTGSTLHRGGWTWSDDQRVATFRSDAPRRDQPLMVSFGAGITDLAGNEVLPRPTPMMRLPSDFVPAGGTAGDAR